MSNFNIKIVGSANMAQVRGEFARLEAQVARLNAEMRKTVQTPMNLGRRQAGVVNPQGYATMMKQMKVNSQVFRDAAASTGMFEAEQLRVNSATHEYTRLLEKQKISFRGWLKQQSVARSAYQEQLRLRSMVVRQMPGTVGGRQLLDVVVPTESIKALDTFGNKMGWAREQVRSFSTQMVNWGKNTQWAGRQLMVGFTMPVVAFGAATGALAYQADAALNKIAKVYDYTAESVGNATVHAAEKNHLFAVSMNLASDAAATFGTSMKETLAVEQELAATGLKGQKLAGSTKEVLRMSTLGDIDPTQTTQMIISLQTAFRKTIPDADSLTNALNYMNAASNASSLSLQDIAEATPRTATAVAQLGGTVEDMTALLVSMREAGVAAPEAANAIKSASTRIIKPSAAALKFYSDHMIDLNQIAKETGGNLFKYLKRLGEEQQKIVGPNEKQTALLRAQGIASLFGTYQNNRLTASLVNLTDAYGGVENQTKKVIDLQKLSNEERQKMADTSLADIMETSAGRIKKAWASLVIDLTKMGEPFLDAGTKMIGMVQKIVSSFNGLPDGLKHFAAGTAIFMAFVGPLVMLTGLFANFFGNMLKGGVFITGLFTKFEILNKESRAAQLASKLAAEGFTTQAGAVQNLTAQIEKLTLAQLAAMRLSGQLPTPFSRMGGAAGAGYFNPRNLNQDANGRWRTPTNQFAKAPIRVPSQLPIGPIGNPTLLPQSALPAAKKIEEDTKSTEKHMRGAAAAGGIFAAAMAASLISSNKTVDKVSQIAMMSAMLGPALWAGFGVLKTIPWATIAASIKLNMGVGMVVAANGAKTFASTLRATPGIMGKLGVVARSTGRGLYAMLGPIGLMVVGLTAAGFALYKWHEHEVAITKEKEAQARAMYDQKNLLQDQLDIQTRQSKRIGIASASDVPGQTTARDLADEMANNDAYSSLIGSMKNSDTSDFEKQTVAMRKYVDILNAVGGGAVKARRYVEALYLAADSGALEAQQKTQDVVDALGGNWDINIGDLWTRQITATIGDTSKSITEQGTAMGKALADSLARGTADESATTINTFSNSIDKAWNDTLNELDDTTKNTLKDLGISSGVEFKKIYDGYKKLSAGDIKPIDFAHLVGADSYDSDKVMNAISALQLASDSMQGFSDKTEGLLGSETAVTKELASQLGITEDITTLAELRNTYEWKLFSLKRSGAKSLYDERVSMLESLQTFGGLLSTSMAVTDEQKLQILNQIRLALGMSETTDLADGFKNKMTGATGEIDKATGAAGRLAAKLAAAKDINWADQFKSVMQDTQSEVSDIATSNFTNTMNSAMEDFSNSQNARLTRLDNSQQNAQDAFEKRWDRRKQAVSDAFDSRIKHIDNEIKAEQKADEIRKRIFDAEIQRMQRLAEMANTNIDFNVAINTGNLDEAAKIRNDMQAKETEWALGASGDAADRASQRRQDELGREKDHLDKIKDKRLKHLEEVEAAEKKALERRQERNKAALQEEVNNNIAAQQEIWDNRKDKLDRAIELFQNYVPKNEKDLREHIKEISGQYSDFNVETEGKFNVTAVNVGKMLAQNVKDASDKIKNDISWAGVGDKIATDMIQGAFGMTPAQFQSWLKTGKWPKGADITAPDYNSPTLPPNKAIDQGHTYHTGGIVGKDKGGYAGFRKGHPDEVKATLLSGEGVLNRKAMSKIGPHGFRALNNGEQYGTGGFAGMGLAGIMGAMMFRAVTSTLGLAMINGGKAREAQNAAAMGPYSTSYAPGTAGMYSDRFFGAEQLKNAATIASVGQGMGMSKRDIEIGIMTAITESGLINVQYGDRDSLGLFQQRPSQGWGTPEQVTNPEYAAKKFFSVLKGVSDRGDMAPWLAAQAVQRSAYSDGSNYKQYWDNAMAIFGGLSANGAVGMAQGSGGRHRPVASRFGLTQGIHDGYTGFPAVDFGVPVGTPVYAAADGRVTKSYDITGFEPRNAVQNGYRSYGRVIEIDHGPFSTLYAHLAARRASAGAQVKGGTQIGDSGNTGHSTGPHLHFGAQGISPMDFVQLRKGTQNVKWDNTVANLHKGEAVLTEDINNQFREGVRRFAEGPNAQYNLNMTVNGADMDADELVNKTMTAMRRLEMRKPQSRTGK